MNNQTFNSDIYCVQFKEENPTRTHETKQVKQGYFQ